MVKTPEDIQREAAEAVDAAARKALATQITSSIEMAEEHLLGLDGIRVVELLREVLGLLQGREPGKAPECG